MFSCDDTVKVADICTTHPEICAEFQEDNWCRAERRKLLVTYHNLQTEQQESQQYKMLLNLEKYSVCMKKASLIEHKKFKEKKNLRISNYMNAKQRIQQISNETVNSEDPLLLYYHWSRNNNKNALAKLLTLENTDAVENVESQVNLATYYVKRDIGKTFDFLFHALELYKPGDEIDDEIFKTLTTLFIDKKKYKQAYIWLKVFSLNSSERDEFTEQQLENYARSFNLDREFLDKVATTTLKNIKAGSFVKPN
ncbi:DUF2989 domain-containing protein [Thalassotalea sp. PLHSN55]|uniref:DUF2989 domain-containing protein n=1 Tax=Thalassotalea sp. PLHSN55 TaxID=3435888 RepID=UPI003F85144D